MVIADTENEDGKIEIVTEWEQTLSNEKVASEKLVKESIDLKADINIVPSNLDIVNLIYPVGSIYLSVNNTNPSILFGGEWEQLIDTFLYASTTADANSTTATGGEARHTLTVDEMPSHQHKLNQWSHITSFNGNTGKFNVSTATNGNTNIFKDDQDQNRYSVATGGGQSHNNMPPYMRVYMWKRTA